MITIALFALVLRIVVQALISRTMAQNESNAEDTLKNISAALENFAKANNESYPENFSDLTRPQPPYLDRNYPAISPYKGYTYTCSRLEPSGYNCTASPDTCNLSGSMHYSVTAGGGFVSEACSNKE